jgi:ribonuclease P protein component
MTNGSQAIWTAADVLVWSASAPVRENKDAMPGNSPDLRQSRLRKHADYQRVYQASRKHFSPSMSYFFRFRTEEQPMPPEHHVPPRVGLTAGRVLGKAVERNRIKRRMREAVRMNLDRLPDGVDVVLHPRKSVLDADFAKLAGEVARIFSTVSVEAKKTGQAKKRAEAAL